MAVVQKKRERRGEESQARQESRPTFLQLDFPISDADTRLLQHAEGGDEQRAGRGGGKLPPPSHSVALLARMGLAGKELLLTTARIHTGFSSAQAMTHGVAADCLRTTSVRDFVI